MAAVLLAASIALVGWRATRPVAESPAPRPSASEDEPLTVAQVYQTVAPSVVSITARDAAGRATGTGVVANADGTILTALHVVADARDIEVVFADGTRTEATVAGTDPANDIATLTPDTLPGLLVPVVLGGAVAIGEAVVAIGDQLGLAGSTTSGVVSGLDRSAASAGGEDLAGLVQFDAAVNPGSSGGPLVNLRGELVGVVVALANPTRDGTFIGVGFAVPIGTAAGTGPGDGPQL
ncbi:hypothetical protein Jiend_62830 [Micromonospora endophytica]|uniref:S1C family serine protease n=1 Tax=Micromonospora endophytica TaxID=515350 RepID=UPI001C32E7BF|nr:trypsin-like peptidase domain-containing protein [Micromonospora endophytica]BCJ62861.1 hypothetical protein Jiend_62830 [Micromonospora endophytica]